MNKIAEKAVGSAGAAVRALNPHLFGRQPVAASARPCVDGKRLRQDPKPLMNKLESDFHETLKRLHPGAIIWVQALRFRLGNGIWYKPDFAALVTEFADGQPVTRTRLTCWEVKGPHAFRGGFENLKVAAGLYPSMKWELVWKEDSRWQHQEVLP